MFVSGRGTYELAVRGLNHCCWEVTRGNVRESVAIAVIGHEWELQSELTQSYSYIRATFPPFAATLASFCT